MRALAETLVGCGIDVELDLWHATDPAVDWTRWGQRQVDECEVVLVALNAAWARRWRGDNRPDEGQGVVVEADTLKGIFQADQVAFQRKVVLVLLPGTDDGDIPADLRRLRRVRLMEVSSSGITELLRLLTGQPEYVKPVLGAVPALPPQPFVAASRGDTQSGDDRRPWRLARKLRAVPAGLLKGGALLNKGVMSVDFSPDGRVLATGGHDGVVRLWDPDTGERLREFVGQSGWLYAVAFSPDGRSLASGADSGTVRTWSLATGAMASDVAVGGPVNSLAFSPDGKWLAAADQTGQVQLWESATSSPVLQVLRRAGGAMRTVAFGPDGVRLAASEDDGTLHVWDVPSGRPLAPYTTPHRKGIWSTAFSPDGSLLATGGGDGSIRLWRAEDGHPFGTPMTGHARRVRRMLFSADGTVLYSCSDDKTVRSWSVAATRPLQTIRAHTDWIFGLALDPNGTRLAVSATQRRDVHLWERAPH